MPEDAAIRRTELKRTQQQALAVLTSAGAGKELSRGEYQELTGVSRSQAAYDLAALVEAGHLRRVGAGRATRYKLAREAGNHRHWTNERIRAELEAFCAGRNGWPSAGDFKAAGRGDLYVAASRYGGIRHWAETIGHPPAGKAAAAAPRRRSLPGRIALAGAGAVAAAAGAVAAVALVVAGAALVLHLTRSGPSSTLSAGPVGKAAPAKHATKQLRPPRLQATRAQKPRAAARKTHRQVVKRRSPATRTSTPSATSLAAYTAPRTTTPTVQTASSQPRQSAAPPSATPSGPAPLAAPPSATNPPQPMAAPHK